MLIESKICIDCTEVLEETETYYISAFDRANIEGSLWRQFVDSVT